MFVPCVFELADLCCIQINPEDYGHELTEDDMLVSKFQHYY